MANMQLYRQCKLKREYEPGLFAHTVSFLPDNFATKGARLELKNHKGEWENGWEVEGVSEATKSLAEVNDMHHEGRRIVEKDDHGRLRGK